MLLNFKLPVVLLLINVFLFIMTAGCSQKPENIEITAKNNIEQNKIEKITQEDINDEADNSSEAIDDEHESNTSSETIEDEHEEVFDGAISIAKGAKIISNKDSLNEERANLAIDKWSLAIELLQDIPKSSSRYVEAQKNIKEYQHNIDALGKKKEKSQVSVTASNSIPRSKNTSDTSSGLPKRRNTVTARSVFDSYLNDIVNKGYTGYTYWCKSSEKFRSSFYAPRKAEILRFSEYDTSASATVRLESSNKGGLPITANWRFYMKNEGNGWCISLVVDQ